MIFKDHVLLACRGHCVRLCLTACIKQLMCNNVQLSRCVIPLVSGWASRSMWSEVKTQTVTECVTTWKQKQLYNHSIEKCKHLLNEKVNILPSNSKSGIMTSIELFVITKWKIQILEWFSCLLLFDTLNCCCFSSSESNKSNNCPKTWGKNMLWFHPGRPWPRL